MAGSRGGSAAPRKARPAKGGAGKGAGGKGAGDTGGGGTGAGQPGAPITWADEEPLVLVGTPQALTGRVRVANRGDRRASLRHGRLVASARDAAALVGDPAADAPAPVARVRSFSVRAGETRAVPLSVDLGPHVPPGEYRAEVDVGGLQREAVLRVLARPSLVVTPRRVVVTNVPGASETVQVVVRNTGNVAMTIGEIGGIPLDEDTLECRIVRRALAEFDEAEDTYEDFFTEVVRQAKRTLEEAGPLRVANRSGETVVAPGERAVLDLEVTVPSGVDRHARYTGAVALGDAAFGVVIVPATARPT